MIENTIKRGLIIIFTFLICTQISSPVFSESLSSSDFDLSLTAFYSGGGVIASTNFDLPHSVLGEIPASPTDLSSTSLDATVGVVKLYVPLPTEKVYLIGDLRAKTDVFGENIAESVWQTDNSPYFYWSILTQPPELIIGFSISLDTAPDDEVDTTETSYQYADNAIPDGKHTFFVKPFGGDTWGDTISFNIWVDTLPPVVNSNSPAPGSIISESEIEILCYINDTSSGVNINKTSMFINGEKVPAEYDEETKKFSFTTTALPEGNNTVLVKTEDNVGNETNKSWTFIVDTIGPLGAILINSGDEVTHSPYVILDLAAEDDTTEVVKMYISNDGVFDDELNLPFEFSVQIKNWLLKEPDKDGLKTVYVIFEDKAGNHSDIYSASITLRLLTPDTRIISAPLSVTEETDATFIYEATKPGCVFSYRLDDADWSEWSSNTEVTFNNLSLGNHYFLVKSAFDLNGDGEITIDEEDATPAQWVWTIGRPEDIEKLREILFWKRQ